MQIIWRCPVDCPKAYLDGNVVDQVVPDCFCPRCASCAGLQAHGEYERFVTTFLGAVFRIPVARFLLQSLWAHRQLFAALCLDLPPPTRRFGPEGPGG